jgi:hypothetical protein
MYLRVTLACNGKRLFVRHGNEGIQDRIVLLDPIQARLCELDRGNRSAAEQFGCLTQRQAGQIIPM